MSFQSIKLACLIFCLIFVYLTGFVACDNQSTVSKPTESKLFPKASLQLENITSTLSNSLNSPQMSIDCMLDTTRNDSLIQIKIKEFYTNNNFKLVWINEQGINSNTELYLASLDSLKFDGLQPEHYSIFKQHPEYEKFKTQKEHSNEDWSKFELCMTKSFFMASHDMVIGKLYDQNKKNKNWKNVNDSTFDEVLALKKSILANDFNAAFAFMRPKHPWYTSFRAEYIRLDSLKKSGDVSQITQLKDSIPLGFSSPEIALLRKRLFTELKLDMDSNSSVCDAKLIETIKTFQFRNQLKATGKLDTATLRRLNLNYDLKQQKLALNMERMRWLRHDFAQPYIWSNIPKMEVDYVENDSVMFNMRTVVGRPSRATMTLDTKIKDIVFSPPWIVPPTILKEDVLPGLARRGGSYLARKGLRAYDRRGRQVSGSGINSSNFRNFSFGQAPGYNSSLGEIKFNMPNPWSIYMHDTPHREDFVKFYRANSSGCVRVHKPKEFAAFLLRDSAKYSYQKVDSICKLRKTIFVPMTRNINVHFVYLTTALDSTGNIMYLKDIYDWDNKVIGMK
jgi:murein L,D-transpeptidase YcbB/YkuD